MMPGNNDASDTPIGSVGDDATDTQTDTTATAGESLPGSVNKANKHEPDQKAKPVVEPDSAQDLNHDPGQATATSSGETSSQSDGEAFMHNQQQAEVTNGAADETGISDTADGSLDSSQSHAQTNSADDENSESEESLRDRLQKAEARASDNWDRLLRLQAEMENQRKRAQNDVNKARKFALEGIVNDLLPVKDSLEMGLAAAQVEEADTDSIVEGAQLTLKMIAQVFEKNNILEVNPVDEKFNPEFHQAMSMQEIEGKAPNTVTSVMQKGYTLNDRLVRPALVMVAK